MPLKIIEIGINEDGEHAVTLVGDADAVKAAAKLWGEPVALVAENGNDPRYVRMVVQTGPLAAEERAALEAERDKALDEATDAMSDLKEAEANLNTAIFALLRIAEGGGATGKAREALDKLGQSYLVRKRLEAATASWPNAVEKAAQKLVDKVQAPYRLEGEIKVGDLFDWAPGTEAYMRVRVLQVQAQNGGWVRSVPVTAIDGSHGVWNEESRFREAAHRIEEGQANG
jgi:hypothetical protein